MGNEHVHPAFHEALRQIQKPVTRFDWQKQIEEAIVAFNADANEAAELLDAWTAALKNRYYEGQLSDVLHEAGQLREALEELDTTTEPTDADIAELLADQEYGNDIEEGEWK